MRKRTFTLALVVLAVIGFASTNADAGTIKMITESGYRTSPGGEFTVAEFSGFTPPAMGPGMKSPNGEFQTFCVEKDQSFSPGTTYDWAMNTYSDKGTGSSGQRDLATQTAWLYSEFYNGDLRDYVKTPGTGRAVSAGDLQNLIWHFQDNTLWNLSSFTTLQQKWLDDMAADTNWDFTGGEIGNVRILNLTRTVSGNTSYHQDQLVMVPLPGAAVAGFAMLAGLGMIGVARRRRRSRMM